MGNSRSVLVSILAISLYLIASSQQFPQEHHEVIVRLILVDVTVTNGKGNFVTDLTKEDFEVYEDGKLRPIHSVELITLITQKEIIKEFPGERLEEEIKSRKRIYVIFDCVNTDLVSLRRAKEKISDFLLSLIREGFEIKIMEINSKQGLRILSDFTSEAGIVKDTVSRIEGNLEVLFLTKAQELEFRELEELQWRNLLQKTISYLLQVIGMIKEAPGRKSVLLMSSGFPEKQSNVYPPPFFGKKGTPILRLFDPFDIIEKQEYTEIMDEIIRYANTHHISFYCLDPSIVESAESNFALSQLSEETGGAYFRGSNKFVAGEEVVKRDLTYYYNIAYTPLSKKEDGKFHHLEVNVRRKGLKVRFRQGYADYREEDIKKRDLAAAFFAPSFYQDIGFDCTITALPQRKNLFKFWGRLNLPLAQFRQAAVPPEKVTFLFGIKEMEEERVHIGEMEIDIKEDLDKGESYLFYHFGTTDVKIKPGRYEVSVVLTHEGDRTGAWEGWIEVPDLQKERASKIVNFLPGKIIENKGRGLPFMLAEKEGALNLKKHQFVPLWTDRIEGGNPLPVFIQVFTPGKEIINEPEFYLARESGQFPIQSELIEKEYNRRSGCHSLVCLLRTEEIPSGDHDLILKLADSSGEKLYKKLKIRVYPKDP